MPRNQNTTKVTGFAGLTNTVAPEELTRADRSKFPLLEAENVYLTNARRLRSRPGFSLAVSGDFHSFWSGVSDTLVASGDQLLAVKADLTTEVLRSGLTPRSQMSYSEATPGRVFYMNDQGEHGSVVNGNHRVWGLPALDAPVTSNTVGALPAGEYRVAITQRQASGEESGVQFLRYARVTANTGLYVEIPELHASAAFASVYCSLANSDTLYEVAKVSSGTEGVTIRNTRDFGQPLKTLDVIPPPSGQMCTYHGGRMYVVVGELVYYSDPFAHSWFREEQFFAFPEPVTLIAPVDGGMYVCANKVYYLSGDDPAQMQQDVVSDARAVKGTLNYIEPGEIAEITRRHAVWMTDRGFVVGAPGGTLQHVTEADFTFPVSAAGALGKVKYDGVTTLVGTMKSPTDEDNDFGLADRVSIEIIRNKVV